MSFSEVDLFGVYVAPAAPILVAAALAFLVLRRATDGLDVLRHVWHPALFEFAVYIILVSGLTLVARASGRLNVQPRQRRGRTRVPAGPAKAVRRAQSVARGALAFSRRWPSFALAAALGWHAWRAYMGTPWTRDGTVRAYVVRSPLRSPARSSTCPSHDNQFVHKGDLLMQIDPSSYAIAVRQAEAAVAQAKAVAAERRGRVRRDGRS